MDIGRDGHWYIRCGAMHGSPGHHLTFVHHDRWGFRDSATLCPRCPECEAQKDVALELIGMTISLHRIFRWAHEWRRASPHPRSWGVELWWPGAATTRIPTLHRLAW